MNFNYTSATSLDQNSHSGLSFCTPPFGMQIQEREYTSSYKGYRYGFNGKESDYETFSSCVAFEARIYDSRLGRFLSCDPLMHRFIWQSSYLFAGNSPISLIDVLGMSAGDPMKKQKLKSGDTPGGVASENNMSLEEFAKSNEEIYSGENYNYEELWNKDNWSFTVGADVNVKDKELIEFNEWDFVEPSSTPSQFRKQPHAKSKTVSDASTGFQFQTTAYPETLSELIDAGLSGAEISYLMGDLQSDIFQDDEFNKVRFNAYLDAKLDPRYGVKSFRIFSARTKIRLGASMVGGEGSLDRVTWSVGGANIKYMISVHKNGSITVEYRIHDILDLVPSNSRGYFYNLITSALGETYHEVNHGNKFMHTRTILIDYWK